MIGVLIRLLISAIYYLQHIFTLFTLDNDDDSPPRIILLPSFQRAATYMPMRFFVCPAARSLFSRHVHFCRHEPHRTSRYDFYMGRLLVPRQSCRGRLGNGGTMPEVYDAGQRHSLIVDE